MTPDGNPDPVTRTPRTWSRQHILERVAELDERVGWYQDIDLGGGIHTKSRVLWGEAIDHPRQRWGNIASAVPNDLSGKSVLDIGCNAGYLALEAKKRGADYVSGIDVRDGYIEQARFCADVLELDVDFQLLSIYDLDKVNRQFDPRLLRGHPLPLQVPPHRCRESRIRLRRHRHRGIGHRSHGE